MIFRYILFFIISIFVGSAFAANKTLIVMGGGDDFTLYPRYYQVINHAARVSHEKGWDTYLLSVDGKKGGYGSMSAPAMSKKDIEDGIKKMSATLKDGETLTIFISDHGDGPDSVTDPISSGIVLYGGKRSIFPPTLSHKELLEMIEKNVKPTNRVVLIGTHCFSGGIHEVSMQSKTQNICSASSTDFRSPSWEGERVGYGLAMWSEIENQKTDFDHDGKTNLFEAQYASSVKDVQNGGRGSLSSSALIESVLKSGAYDPKNEVGFSVLDLLIRMEAGVWRTRGKIHGFYELDQRECTANQFNENVAAIEKILASLEMSALFADFKEQVGEELPQAFKVGYETAVADWGKNKKQYEQTFRKYSSNINRKKAEWDALSPIEKLKQRASYTQFYESAKEQLGKDLGPFFNTAKTLSDVDNLKSFLRIASTEEKKKLISLMNCEATPL